MTDDLMTDDFTSQLQRNQRNTSQVSIVRVVARAMAQQYPPEDRVLARVAVLQVRHPRSLMGRHPASPGHVVWGKDKEILLDPLHLT